MERKFSYLYSELVDDENDMIGHIAYSLYKSNKIEFIKQFKDDNPDKNLSEDDLNAFHRSVRTTIPALRIQAEQLLSNFTQLTFGETVHEIEIELKNNQEKILKDIVEPLKPQKKSPWDGFWMSVIVKGVQAFIIGLFFFIVIFAASAKENFWGAVRDIIPEGKNTTTINNQNGH